MTRLDIFIDKLDSLSTEPIKEAYKSIQKVFLNENNDIESDLQEVYYELLYFILTDLEYGYETYLKRLELEKELELIKDIIAYDCSQNTRIELNNIVKNLKVEIDLEMYNPIIASKIKTFIFSGTSLIDDRYAANLAEHLVNCEQVDIDFISSFIFKRIEKKRRTILKL